MLPSAASLNAAAVPVTPRELTVGPQRRRNVTGLPMLQLVAVPRVRVPPRKGAGRHVDPSLARELERLDYSAWLAVGKALASLTDKVIERGRAAGVRVPVWKPTSELGMGTPSRRWRRISTPKRARPHPRRRPPSPRRRRLHEHEWVLVPPRPSLLLRPKQWVRVVACRSRLAAQSTCHQ